MIQRLFSLCSGLFAISETDLAAADASSPAD